MHYVDDSYITTEKCEEGCSGSHVPADENIITRMVQSKVG